MANVGVVVMQGCRPGKCGFEPLFKALHHGSGQFVHIEIALHILPHRVGAQLQPVKVGACGRVSDKLVGLLSAHTACRSKERAGELFLVAARPLLNVADVGLCRCPLPCSPFAIIGSDNRHCALCFLPLPPSLFLLFVLIDNPALDFPDKFLKFG